MAYSRTTFLNVLDPNMYAGKSRESPLDRRHPNCTQAIDFCPLIISPDCHGSFNPTFPSSTGRCELL